MVETEPDAPRSSVKEMISGFLKDKNVAVTKLQKLVEEVEKSIKASSSKSGDNFMFEKELGVEFKDFVEVEKKYSENECKVEYDKKKVDTFFHKGKMILVTLGITSES